MQDNPFETRRELRGRSLLMVGILTVVVTALTFFVFFRYNRDAPLPKALFNLFLYGFFFLFNFSGISRARLSYNRLLGTCPRWRTLGGYAFWVVPLFIISIAGTYVLYLPLSYVFP